MKNECQVAPVAGVEKNSFGLENRPSKKVKNGGVGGSVPNPFCYSCRLLFLHSPISLAPTKAPNEGEPKMDQVNHEGEEELGCRSHGRSDMLGEPERLSDRGERGSAVVEICMKIEKAAT